MTHRAAVVLFAVAGFAALAFAGDDAKTYDIDWHEHWKPGQVVTVTLHEKDDSETAMSGTTLDAEHLVLDTTYVVRCDAVDAEGKPTKRTVFVKSWQQVKDSAPDDFLTGALVIVDGKSWKLADGRTPNAGAKKWLEQTFSKDDADPITKLAPPKLTVGQAWKPDPKAAAEAFAKAMDDAPFDAAGVTMELKLVSAEGAPPDAKGKVEIKLHAPITAVPGLPQGATIGAGSGAEVTGDRAGPLTTFTMLGVEHLEMDLTMIVNLPKVAGGKVATTKGHMSETKSIVAGGEIPEPKPATPAPGGK